MGMTAYEAFIQALGASKSYTNKTIEGAGALKGKNCTIKSIIPIEGGNRVTFEWTLDNGTVETDTMDVMNGEDGNDGSTVTYTQTLQSGTKIGEISIDGTKTNIFAPNGGSASDFDKFCDNIDVDYAYDSTTGANYTVIRVYKDKLDATKEYPYVRYKNMYSALELAEDEDWFLTITGGLFDNTGASPVHAPDGVVIENGEVLNNEINVLHAGSYPLLIDSNGNLSYAQPDETGLDIMENYPNTVSAVGGWQPIIENYQPLSQLAPLLQWSGNMQRMIIGQFGNGDYAIVTCEGRNFDHSDGWTMPEAISICQKLGLKFAYNLDGGGSTELVLGKKQLNTIYENAKGRKLSTFVVFNGGTTFNPEIGNTLSSIKATKTITEYEVGDTFSASDIVVIANYSDGTHANVTQSAIINTSSVDMSTAGTYTISVSYTEGGVTKTANISVVVSQATPKTLTSITATKTQTTYQVGDTLATNDIVVTAHYSDNTNDIVTSSATINTSSVDMSTEGTYSIGVSYTEDGVTETTSISITVSTTGKNYFFKAGYPLSAESDGTISIQNVATRRAIGLTDVQNDALVRGYTDYDHTAIVSLGYLIPIPSTATSVTVYLPEQAGDSFKYIAGLSLWKYENGNVVRKVDGGWGSQTTTSRNFGAGAYDYFGVGIKRSDDGIISDSTDTSEWTITFT